MSRSLGSLVLLLASSLALLASAASSSCHSEQPLLNDYFKVSCSKERYLEVEILCRWDVAAAGNLELEHAWHQLPGDSLNLTGVHTTHFRNCSFPAELRLLDVALRLGALTNNTLVIEGARSPLRRAHLAGFKLKELHLRGGPDGLEQQQAQLQPDLLWDVELEMLEIQGVALGRVPPGFFRPGSRLEHLEISGSGLLELGDDDLAELSELKVLLLFDNELRELSGGSLERLASLKVLDLSRNRLRGLPGRLLRKLRKLDKLNLSENEFEALDGELLRGSELYRFRLNHNRGGMASLPAGFFRNVSSLNYVELTSNRFESLPADLFAGARSLTALNISNNSLASLPAGLFDNTHLEELRASENQLLALPENLFQDVYLKKLYLNDNRLTNLTINVVAGLATLELLQLSRNNLTYIQSGVCEHYLKNVKFVDLSHNQLTLVDPNAMAFSALANCIELQDLNLSHNNITEIFSDWDFYGNLKILNLENNKISHITAHHLKQLKLDTELNLRHNQISTIDLTDLETLAKQYHMSNPNISKNAVVLLENNPLNCDCHMLDFFRYKERQLSKEVYTFVNIYITEEMRCDAPLELRNVQIAEIPSEELRCLSVSNETGDACNGTCTCWNIPGKRVLSVDCSRRNLSSVPARIANPFNWSIELNMTGNRLREAPALNRSTNYLLNVTVLDLSYNNLSHVSLDVFSESLRQLILHNNSISRLDDRVIEHLFDDELLNKLTLHGNPWICDCEAKYFHLFVHRKSDKFKLREVSCWEERHRRLSEISTNEVCDTAVVIIVAACLLIAFFGVVFGCLAALYYRYQKEIKVWLYSKQWCLWLVTEDELDKDKLYDAFISFSHKDEDFVEKEIVAKLEEGPWPYKLCLHYRDWLAGEWIPAQIARSVEESRRTIVILSPNFLESVWGRMEFRTAHNQALSEGRARVIVVLYGDIGNTEDLDPELKAYLSMNTYVKWGDPWFWDKLRYALPHKHELPRKRRSRNARIIENHLAQLPTNNHHHHRHNDKAEVIPMPKITAHSNDSTKLLESGAEDERVGGGC